jgi:hypothetical protein
MPAVQLIRQRSVLEQVHHVMYPRRLHNGSAPQPACIHQSTCLSTCLSLTFGRPSGKFTGASHQQKVSWMEIAALASFLAPFMRYLLKAGEPLAEEAARKINEKAWVYAKALWARLRPKVDQEPTARAAAEDLADDPDDEDRLAALRVQLKKLLAADPALAKEMTSVWEQAEAEKVVVSVIGDRSVGIGGSVSGSTIITGDDSKAGS